MKKLLAFLMFIPSLVFAQAPPASIDSIYGFVVANQEHLMHIQSYVRVNSVLLVMIVLLLVLIWKKK